VRRERKIDDKNVAFGESCICVSRIDDQRGLLRVLPAAPHCEIINPLTTSMSEGNANPMDGMENNISPRAVRRDDGED
jgi:hypothetical protein